MICTHRSNAKTDRIMQIMDSKEEMVHNEIKSFSGNYIVQDLLKACTISGIFTDKFYK